DLMVYDISSAAMQFLTDQGARSCESPAEVAAKCQYVFLSLPNTAVVEKVLFGPGGIVEGAKAGLGLIDLSTITYMGTLDIAKRLAEKGIRFADAPVSGMESRAKEGTLSVMFGGDEAFFAEVEPHLKAIGNTIVHMGPIGAGQLTKLINQLLFNACMASMAEILPMGVKLGLDPEKLTKIVTTGTGRSFGLEFFAPRILENKFDAGYPLKDAYKDMISAMEISAHQKIPLPMVQSTATTFQMALAEGYGSEDKGAMIKVFERLLGVKFRKKGFEND
ncbi:MAG: NAD(P)-dependent oxidoreductase, partial [Chloroflexota bacterium]